jgi:diadenosine tetraphosphate (Ap4A) HIT family hydrolase
MPDATWRTDRIGSALNDTNPTVLRRFPAGFAAIGDVQFLPGYCVFLTDTPGVDRLSDLPRPQRLAFLTGAEALADAVETVCSENDDAFRRVNIEILGNRDSFLHAHVWPRYEWEPAAVKEKPVWLYPAVMWRDERWQLAVRHIPLKRQLEAALDKLAA